MLTQAGAPKAPNTKSHTCQTKGYILFLRAPRRPNKGRKHNGNTPKDRNNRTKRLALLGRGPSG